jgi:hypothetical protein
MPRPLMMVCSTNRSLAGRPLGRKLFPKRFFRPDDTNALFAMTLSVGMPADYAILIDKRQVDSLKMIRDADRYAKKL